MQPTTSDKFEPFTKDIAKKSGLPEIRKTLIKRSRRQFKTIGEVSAKARHKALFVVAIRSGEAYTIPPEEVVAGHKPPDLSLTKAAGMRHVDNERCCWTTALAWRTPQS